MFVGPVLRVFQPTSGAGSGSGASWDDVIRELLMRHLVARVPPAAVPDMIAATVLAVAPWALDEGLRVPTVQFVRGMRAELGKLAKIEASLSVDETERMKAAATDASPLHDKTEVVMMNGRLADGTGMVFGGCYRIGAQTAAGEANSAELMFNRMDGRNTTVREEVTRLLGASAAAALPQSGAVGLRCRTRCAAPPCFRLFHKSKIVGNSQRLRPGQSAKYGEGCLVFVLLYFRAADEAEPQNSVHFGQGANATALLINSGAM